MYVHILHHPETSVPCLGPPREYCLADFDWPTGSVRLFGCLPNTNPQQLTTRHSGEVPYWQGWSFLPFYTHNTSIHRGSYNTNACTAHIHTSTNQLWHKLHTHFKQTDTGANPGAGTVCLCVWICITQPTPGRSQNAPLKVHKSWMFWPVITRPPAFQVCRVPESDRQPSSLGLKQTLWNVLMGRKLILGQNLSGSPAQPQVYHPATLCPSLKS